MLNFLLISTFCAILVGMEMVSLHSIECIAYTTGTGKYNLTITLFLS